MLCPAPVPVNIPLIFMALATVPVVVAWLGSKLNFRSDLKTHTDLKAAKHLGRPSARRRMATPIGNVPMLTETLKAMGYSVAYDPGRLRIVAAKGTRGIEFQGQADGTWEAQVVPAIPDAAFRAQVKAIVAAYAKKSQTPAAARHVRHAPAFAPDLKTAVKTEPAPASPQWTPPARQAVKVGAR